MIAHHQKNSLPMMEARKVLKKLRDDSKTGKVAAFVFALQHGEGYRVSLCTVSDDNKLWMKQSADPLVMKRCAGVYTERATLEDIADDFVALGMPVDAEELA